MGITNHRRLNALALLAIALLALLPTFGRLCSRTHVADAPHMQVMAHAGHDHHSVPDGDHHAGACKYCAILGSTDLPATVANRTVPSATAGEVDVYRDTPSLTPHAWTLGSRGPPRHPRA